MKAYASVIAGLMVTGLVAGPGFAADNTTSPSTTADKPGRLAMTHHVTGNVVNTFDRDVVVSVIAGFYDAGGRPMQRPFTVLRLQGLTKYATRFVGPSGSAKAYLFVGDTAY